MKAKEIAINDIITFKLDNIYGWQSSNGEALKGIVRYVGDYVIRNKSYKYVKILTENGFQSAYLAFNDNVVKEVMSKEEARLAVLRAEIRTLPRTVFSQGSDPEMFVVDKDCTVIPAFKFLKDKNRVKQMQPFWDGFQAEYNIPGLSCLDSTVSCLRSGLVNLKESLRYHDEYAKLSIKSVIDIPPHMLTNEKEKYVRFGCMPSKNVYEMKGIQADGKDVNVRFAGGHIHFELENNQKKKIPEYVKALDAILGVACVTMFANIDDPIRRSYYGLAGEYRTPSHGLEYRTLSNAWLCHPTITYITFELARKVISLVDKGLFKHWQYNEEDVISCINECNIPLALEILKTNEDMFKDILMSFCYLSETKTKVVYNTILGGADVLVDDVSDIESNWNLVNVAYSFNYGNYQIANIERNPNYKKVLAMKL